MLGHYTTCTRARPPPSGSVSPRVSSYWTLATSLFRGELLSRCPGYAALAWSLLRASHMSTVMMLQHGRGETHHARDRHRVCITCTRLDLHTMMMTHPSMRIHRACICIAFTHMPFENMQGDVMVSMGQCRPIWSMLCQRRVNAGERRAVLTFQVKAALTLC
jgi:hypothetical protein